MGSWSLIPNCCTPQRLLRTPTHPAPSLSKVPCLSKHTGCAWPERRQGCLLPMCVIHCVVHWRCQQCCHSLAMRPQLGKLPAAHGYMLRCERLWQASLAVSLSSKSTDDMCTSVDAGVSGESNHPSPSRAVNGPLPPPKGSLAAAEQLGSSPPVGSDR